MGEIDEPFLRLAFHLLVFVSQGVSSVAVHRNPYTDRNPSNPQAFDEHSGGENLQREYLDVVKTHRDPALAKTKMDYEGTGQTHSTPDVAIHHDDGVYCSIDQWFHGEHIPWNVAFPHAKFTSTVGYLFAGSGPKVTCLTYAQAWFEQPFKGIPHTPTKEFARFLEQETGSSVGGVQREYWLRKFEHQKYGLIAAGGPVSMSNMVAKPEMKRSMTHDLKSATFTQPKGTNSSDDLEFTVLIETLQARVEPGQEARSVLPFLITVVDLDFYRVGYVSSQPTSDPLLRILYNMCMGDLNSILVQTGRRYLQSAVPYSAALPFLSRLPEGHWENPRSMSGDPVPQTAFVDGRQTRRNQALFMRFVNAIFGVDDATHSGSKGYAAWRTLFDSHFTKDGLFYGNPYTLGRASNGEDLYDLLQGVFGSLKDRRLELVDHKGDEFDTVICQGPICAISGFVVGSLEKGDRWLGVAATQDGLTEIRHHVALFLNLQDLVNDEIDVIDTRIKDAYLLVDLPSSAMQLGLDMIKVAQETVKF